MSLFDHSEYDQHESVHYFDDAATGLRAIIAIHSTALGPAGGGCRRWRYASDDDALTDVLRLSRGMTYKCAVAGLKFGGGKAVILESRNAPKNDALLAAFGRAVESLGGAYVTAEDVGMTVHDMRIVQGATRHVSGLPREAVGGGGDPGPWTALGVFRGLNAAVTERLNRDSLEGVRVGVQGVGSVGLNLCRLLAEAGAVLTVADPNPHHIERLAAELPVAVVSPNELLRSDVDVLSPCALGKVLSAESIPGIRARVIAGAANNQLETDDDGERLSRREILYAPDYVINAGGIISCCLEYFGETSEDVLRAKIGEIPLRLLDIFREHRQSGQPTNVIADDLARRLVPRHH